ncbi:MAG: putative toxin-antitoxin system toxin component, PIN family [Acidobacteriota bacterium]
MRAVFDTNVIVAGLVAEGLCHEVLETHLPDHAAVLSQVMWDELVETLFKKFELTPDDLPWLHLYHRHATWVEARPLRGKILRDPDDDWVLSAAAAGRADAIVTGDADLLALGTFQGIAILTPRQFLERLSRSS